MSETPSEQGEGTARLRPGVLPAGVYVLARRLAQSL